jgi:hypothetical protein
MTGTLDDLDRDMWALVIALVEEDQEAFDAIMAHYRTRKALLVLLTNFAAYIARGVAEVIRLRRDGGTDDGGDVPDSVVLATLRHVLASTP